MLTPKVDGQGLVTQQMGAFEIVKLGRARERITGDGHVVVAEDHVRTVETGEQPPETCLAARVRHEVTGHAHEIGGSRSDPRRGRTACSVSAREPSAEMEVRQVTDPEAVERRRKAGQPHLEHACPQPTGLEPAVHEDGRRDARDDQDADEHHGTLEPGRARLTTLRAWERGRAAASTAVRYAACAVGIVGVALLQSMVHLVVVLGEHDYHSRFDLDRSNGSPTSSRRSRSRARPQVRLRSRGTSAAADVSHRCASPSPSAR